MQANYEVSSGRIEGMREINQRLEENTTELKNGSGEINAGTHEVLWLDDDWTVITEDLSLSAHYENTILITEGKPELLTLTESEKAAGYLDLF